MDQIQKMNIGTLEGSGNPPDTGLLIVGSNSGYKILDIETKEYIYVNNIDFVKGSKNLSEFVGLCHAIFFVLSKGRGCYNEIYTNSTTAISWVKRKKYKSSVNGGVILDYAKKCALKINKTDIEESNNDLIINKEVYVKKWNTRNWGGVEQL